MGGRRRRGSRGPESGRTTAADRSAPGRRAAGRGPERAAHRVYLHLAWPTLGRLPLVDGRRAAVLEGHLIDLCRRLGVRPIAVSVRRDRVHLLLRPTPAHAPAEVAGRLKAGSTALLMGMETPIRWGRGYAVRSVSPGEVRRLMRLLFAGEDGSSGPP